MSSFNHRKIESKWQNYWKKENTFATPTDRTRPKYYVLDMFPYPSGAGLHVGHPKGYVATDIVARAKRMMGFNVLRVMGWDSFGLPAERQAMKEGKHPREITQRNIAVFKKQLYRLGLSYDWSREIATSDIDYYRWTQWIFLQLHKSGLAYQADVPVNWCPALQTVLANEEVKNGVYIETGDPVEKRAMKQWMLKITDYAEKLLDGLGNLDWPSSVVKQQQQWIGRSSGAEIKFPVIGKDLSIVAFSTRPNTIFGASYLVLAPEHPLTCSIAARSHRDSVEAYINEFVQLSERERSSKSVRGKKTGVFTGAYALNPLNNERLPIWISAYVLAAFGTGAIFGCPAHDERDYVFATEHNLPIIQVIKNEYDNNNVLAEVYCKDGPHINSGFLNGMKTDEAISAITKWLEEHNAGSAIVKYHLRDWLFSRQRYWGEPFPIVFDDAGKAIALPESQLPIKLPEMDLYTPGNDASTPLGRAKNWVKTIDPKSGLPVQREVNTMPQWAGSCWYYLRFISPTLATAPWDPDEEKYWMPVDLYVGGAEHATLHLMYARFWHLFLFDMGYVSSPEPFTKLVNQGMVHEYSFRDDDGKYYYKNEVEKSGDQWLVRDTRKVVSTRLEKMSKSRYNVVNPNDVCDQFGADALRVYEMFMGAIDDRSQWDSSAVAGTRRFLDRVYRLVMSQNYSIKEEVRASKPVSEDTDNYELEEALHQAIKKVTDAVASLQFNTAISSMMTFVNVATKTSQVPKAWMESFLCILSPFTPHLCEELWEILGHTDGIAFANWPVFDKEKLFEKSVTLAIQINGKVRGTVNVSVNDSRDIIIHKAKSHTNVQVHLAGKVVQKEIYIEGKLVNIVVS